MTNPIPWYLRPKRRSSSDREKVVGLAIFAALFLFIYPFFNCPCGGWEPVRTGEGMEFSTVSCKACKRTGHLSMFDRCFGEAPDPPVQPWP